MTHFRIHQLILGDRYYLPLPKINTSQLSLLGKRLTRLGYSVKDGRILKATKGRSNVNVNPSGLCWSSEDLIDIIGPEIPRILDSDRENTSLVELRERYYSVRRDGSSTVLTFRPRIESSRLWDEMRRLDLCGLTPDEWAVYRRLLLSSKGKPAIFTDFPSEDCSVRRVGNRQYYSCNLNPSEAARSLRVIGGKNEHNVYLPRSGLLSVKAMQPDWQVKVDEVLGDLGDWCYFEAGPRQM